MSSLIDEALKILDSFDAVRQQDNGEKLIHLKSDTKRFRYQQSPWSIPLLWGNHYLREGVLEKFNAGVSVILKELGPRYRVLIMDSYRPPPVQEISFAVVSLNHRMRQPGLGTRRKTEAYTNMFTAIPRYGGHPCGAAIDMTLVDLQENKKLVFGDAQLSTIFGGGDTLGVAPPPPRLAPVYEVMCQAMKDQGFILTPCEWWHFAFGDTEWAATTGADATLYRSVTYQPSMAFGKA